ncbi:MAG: MFS transporter, partial [Anaerolineae bacterium]|nr:MFS transporter [Anaerolineae bacterium]
MSTAEQTPPTAEAGLPVGRNVKIGFFHLGSGMADILTGSVWNRVMIADLGVSATVVGLLTALKYFLSPLGILAGRLSDQRVIGGYRRLFWIWLGRLLMVLSTIMIGLATTQLARNDGGVLVWSAIMVGFTLFSVGSAISGTTFLALIYDRAPEHQRGRAVGIVWTFLLMGFPLGGILFGVLLPAKPADQQALTGLSFAPEMLQNLFLFAAALFGFLWFSALLGEERRSH